VIPVDLVLVIQISRSREVLSQHTVLPADDALGRKRSGNVPVVEVVVVSGEKASSLDPVHQHIEIAYYLIYLIIYN
jgi:hypothetical protein